MESPIYFLILINRNFGDFKIKITKCNRTLEQPDIYTLTYYMINLFHTYASCM